MSEHIKCFLLSQREPVSFTPQNSKAPLITTTAWQDDDGRRYHIGNKPIVVVGTEELLPPAPPGAMWDAAWYRGLRHESGLDYGRYPDGVILCVRTPGGDWIVDGPSFDAERRESGYWSRRGPIPDVTVTPSILQPTYHGWLRNGYLVEC